MCNNYLHSLITYVLLLLSSACFSQTVNLGILTSFEAFTASGDITNSGGTVTGDVGSDNGIITGFDPPAYTGIVYNADSVTAQGKMDLFRLYIHLNDIFVTFPGTHAPAFGGGETLTPGVYSVPAAGSLGGSITLDGEGNPDAFFVINFVGAMTVGTGAVVTLTGQT